MLVSLWHIFTSQTKIFTNIILFYMKHWTVIHHPEKWIKYRWDEIRLENHHGKTITHINKTDKYFTLNPLPQPAAVQDISPVALSENKIWVLKLEKIKSIRLSPHKYYNLKRTFDISIKYLPIHLSQDLLQRLVDLHQPKASCVLPWQNQLQPIDASVFLVP